MHQSDYMKILMIDDNADTSSMMEKFLKLKGHECHTSNNGRDGLSLIESQKFNAILLDLSMPEFTGLDVLEQLNKTGKIKESKIIVFTAQPLTREENENIMSKGVHSILKKPIELSLLLKTLQG